MVYAEKSVPSKFVCLRVPLRSWARFRIARLSAKVARKALRIREKNEVKKYSKAADNETEHEQLIMRIAGIENTLNAMEALLKSICDKLNQS